jgi:hypothetical protein
MKTTVPKETSSIVGAKLLIPDQDPNFQKVLNPVPNFIFQMLCILIKNQKFPIQTHRKVSEVNEF